MPVRNLRQRSFEPEILDGPGVPEDVRERCYRDLARTHRWLGNTAAVVRSLARDPLPVRRVLDVGCSHGALLWEIREALRVEVIGVDLRPPRSAPVRIVCADAIRDRLPKADVAVSLTMAHHLSDEDLRQLIDNVGRSCRRFVILDLVRHPIPLVLFRVFVAPFVHSINVADGIRSIERAFTAREMREIVCGALTERNAGFVHTVTPPFVRQLVDIQYRRA
jgi:SAM-dependent methyltransferase